MNEIDLAILMSVFKLKFIFCPIATSHMRFGVYHYLSVYVFGVRIILLSQNNP